MNTKNDSSEVFVECPHCKVCSIKLSAAEHVMVTSGQQMVEMCQVCGKDVIISV